MHRMFNRGEHRDTAGVVLFDLAALGAGAFLLWSARDNKTKQAISAVCVLLSLIGIAHKAVNYLATPNVQPAASETSEIGTANGNKKSQASEDPNALVCPATP